MEFEYNQIYVLVKNVPLLLLHSIGAIFVSTNRLKPLLYKQIETFGSLLLHKVETIIVAETSSEPKKTSNSLQSILHYLSITAPRCFLMAQWLPWAVKTFTVQCTDLI